VPERRHGVRLTALIPEEQAPAYQPERKGERGDDDRGHHWTGPSPGDVVQYRLGADAPEGPGQQGDRDTDAKSGEENPAEGGPPGA
jgi:hypothetical protein